MRWYLITGLLIAAASFAGDNLSDGTESISLASGRIELAWGEPETIDKDIAVEDRRIKKNPTDTSAILRRGHLFMMKGITNARLRTLAGL